VDRGSSTLPLITNLQETIMSVAGIASNLPFQPVNQAFFFQRRLDVGEVGQAINSGDLTKAQQVYDTLTAPGQNTDSYKPFKSSRLENDFLAVGQALQTGDEAAAQKPMQPCSRIFGKLTLEEAGGPPKSSPTSKRSF
jgi:hypothetical protein